VRTRHPKRSVMEQKEGSMNIVQRSVNKMNNVVIGSFSGGNGMTINGKTYNGNNITISDGVVIVDGVVQDGDHIGYNIQVTVNGNVGEIETGSGDITVNGEVSDVSTSSGDVKCGNVAGNVQTSSGDVTCGTVGGKIKTSSGDVNHR
jgi:hypothetical protein